MAFPYFKRITVSLIKKKILTDASIYDGSVEIEQNRIQVVTAAVETQDRNL